MANNLAKLSVGMVMLAFPGILTRRRMELVGLMAMEGIEALLHQDQEGAEEDKATEPMALKIQMHKGEGMDPIPKI
jgi:hypothetical protein